MIGVHLGREHGTSEETSSKVNVMEDGTQSVSLGPRTRGKRGVNEGLSRQQ